MFGKFPTDSLCGREARSIESSAANEDEIDTLMGYKFDFIPANGLEDERPYLEVEAFGEPCLGLLDSGASRTVLGKSGFEKFKRRNLDLWPPAVTSCKVADGRECPVLGTYNVPFRVKNKVALVEVLVMPSLPHTLIFGTDFWRKLGIVPDLRHSHWRFSDASIPSISTFTDSSHLTTVQSTRLKSFIQGIFSSIPDSLGKTTLVQHVIKTKADPIRQWLYLL